jgi:hypothetical protein
MLLHHAAAPDTAADILAGGAGTTCLAIIQDAAAAAAIKAGAATLLDSLSQADGQQETVLRLRSGGRNTPQILLSVVLNKEAGVAVRERSAHALAQLTATPDGAQVSTFTCDLLTLVSSSLTEVSYL